MDDFEKAIRAAQANPIHTPMPDFRKSGVNQPRDSKGRWTNGAAHGARIDLIDNKDGSRTMYAGGKKEIRGSHADVESHIAQHGPRGSQATVTTPKTPGPVTAAEGKKMLEDAGFDYAHAKEGKNFFNEEVVSINAYLYPPNTRPNNPNIIYSHTKGSPPVATVTGRVSMSGSANNQTMHIGESRTFGSLHEAIEYVTAGKKKKN